MMTDQDWIDRLASQYGAKQAAALRGDEITFKAADMWLASIAEHHWHEIIFAIRLVKNSQYVNRCPHEWYQGRCIHCDVRAVNGRPEQPDKVPASKVADDCGGPERVLAAAKEAREKAERERDEWKRSAEHWERMYVCAQNANSFRQDAIDAASKQEKAERAARERDKADR